MKTLENDVSRVIGM